MEVWYAIGGFRYLGQHLWIMALAILAVAIVQVASNYTFRVYNTKASETLVKSMRDQLFSHIQRLPFSWHMKNKTGDTIQRCTSDIDTTKNFLSEQLTSVFRIVILLILSISFMVSMHGTLTLIALIPMPLIIGYSIHFHKKIHEGFMDCDENEGKLYRVKHDGTECICVYDNPEFEFKSGEAVICDGKIILDGQYVGVRNGVAEAWDNGMKVGTIGTDGKIEKFENIELIY